MTTDPGPAGPDRTEGRVRSLPREECLELLTTTTVGRLAFVDADGQQLVPVNFVLIDDTIYFRTLPDGFLSQLPDGSHPVAFGVDHHDDLYRNGWNVTVRGAVRQVEDRATIDVVLGHSRLRPWAGGVRSMVMAVSIDSVDGRRVSAH
jgi:nitroimidazol reductase NimA-like FMN-containing flavoprotein (pyridoxamine 5'-phosphate oxidase superfamily)